MDGGTWTGGHGQEALVEVPYKLAYSTPRLKVPPQRRVADRPNKSCFYSTPP